MRLVIRTLTLVIVSIAARSAVAQAPAPAPSECFPQCRPGFLCHLGQCVSACNPACEAGFVCSPEGACVSPCNPPCAAGETCGADGQCLAPAPVAAPAPAPAAAPAATPAWQAEADIHALETEPPKPEEKKRQGPPSRIYFEMVSFYGQTAPETTNGPFGETVENTTGTTYVGLSPSLRARIALKHMVIAGDLPFTGALVVPPDEVEVGAAFKLGNPNGSFSGLIPLGKSSWLTGGIGLSLPLASYPEQASLNHLEAVFTAYDLGIGMRGMWDAWRFTPDYLALFTPFELEVGPERVRFGVELTTAQLFYTGDFESEDRFFFQLGGRVQGYFTPVFSIGARIRHAAEVGADADDAFQSSFEPFLEVAAKHFFFSLGVTFNIDAPYGFGSDELTVWGQRLSIGGQL